MLLVVDTADLPALDDPDDFYDHELEGLSAELADGSPLGAVREVVHLPHGDLLAVTTTAGAEVLVPFLAAFVPVVDVAGRPRRARPARRACSTSTPQDPDSDDAGEASA